MGDRTSWDFSDPSAMFIYPEMSGKIEVLRGAASLLYGSNAMGGAINII
jgi:outer membrane receptor for ferrienterochelin and colicin